MDWFVRSFFFINIDQCSKMGDQQGVKKKFMTIASHQTGKSEVNVMKIKPS